MAVEGQGNNTKVKVDKAIKIIIIEVENGGTLLLPFFSPSYINA